MIKTKKSNIILGLIFLAVLVAVGFLASNTNFPANLTGGLVNDREAELYILPESDAFAVGKDFQVTANIRTNFEINVGQGEIHFPVDKLEVVSLSKENSIFSLWVTEPSFSNLEGTVEFAGVLPTPGFKGEKGEAITIVFKAKEKGKAKIEFEKGEILANDGKGTDILKKKNGASYNIINPDLNSDNSVNISDFSILLSNWGTSNAGGDLNGDGKINLEDFSILIYFWTK